MWIKLIFLNIGNFLKNKPVLFVFIIISQIICIISAFTVAGISELANKPVNKLSGGQKQRTAIARAIVNEPSFILADEPTGALDTKTSAEIMSLFKTLNDDGKTVIIITHDNNIAEMCTRKIEISDGKIISVRQ